MNASYPSPYSRLEITFLVYQFQLSKEQARLLVTATTPHWRKPFQKQIDLGQIPLTEVIRVITLGYDSDNFS